MVKLSETLICGRTKMSSVDYVRRLNCWGCDLDDVSIVEQMPNIEVLSLSVNCITTLKHFKGCRRLRELYLRGNLIGDLREVEHLRNLTELRVLWLDENPCAQLNDYRSFVMKTLPFLTNLDNRPVSRSETCEIPSYRVQSRCFDDIQRTNSRVSLNSTMGACPLDDVTEKPRQKCRGGNCHDVGYESSNSDHSNKSSQGPDFYYESSVDFKYRQVAANASGSNVNQSTDSSAAKIVAKRQTGGNVLTAILTLLDDLDEQNLNVVAQNVADRLHLPVSPPPTPSV